MEETYFTGYSRSSARDISEQILVVAETIQTACETRECSFTIFYIFLPPARLSIALSRLCVVYAKRAGVRSLRQLHKGTPLSVAKPMIYRDSFVTRHARLTAICY